MNEKVCSVCKALLSVNLFGKRKGSTDNLRSECKSCRRKTYQANIDKNKQSRAIYRTKNRKKLSLISQEYYRNNKDKKKTYDQIYYSTNKEKIMLQHNKRIAIRTKEDPIFRLRKVFSSVINKLLKINNSSKGGMSCLLYLSYSIQELRDSLEKQFDPWMNWNNYGQYRKSTWNDSDPMTWTWQIDHTVPQSLLPYTSMQDENFKKSWALDNLRPYSAKQNLLDGVCKTRHHLSNI